MRVTLLLTTALNSKLEDYKETQERVRLCYYVSDGAVSFTNISNSFSEIAAQKCTNRVTNEALRLFQLTRQ
jgi:hypothetical protein